MSRIILSRSLRWWLLMAVVCFLSFGLAATIARAAADAESHLVRDGDTLESIAAAHGVTVGGLLVLNPSVVEAGTVHVGQTLRLPAAIDPAQVPSVACPLAYTVRTGDTWTSIAAAHSVHAATLAHVNPRAPVTSPGAGTRLCIPALPEPEPRLACAEGPTYVLQRTPPATFLNGTAALMGGLQVCVGSSWTVAGTERNWVKTENGRSGWILADHLGTWPEYLASRDATFVPPTPTTTPTATPTATPRPTHTATPASAPCRDAWGASAVAYRVRTGPGTQHAHTGKYVAAGEPVCELERDRGWVRVRLADGETGWVHGDGITNRRPAPIPVATPTPVPSPTAVAPPPTPLPASRTASGIVHRGYDFGYTLDMSAGWHKEWGGYTDALWTSDGGALRIRTYLQPAGSTLEQVALAARDNTRRDWREDVSLFEIRSLEKRRVGDQEHYFLKYRVQESPEYCVLDIEEAIGLGQAPVGPARAFRVEHAMCEGDGFERLRRTMLDSLRIVVEQPSVYAQYLDVDGLGIWIKAPQQVDPGALHEAADIVSRMLARARPGIPACLAAWGADLAIIPKDWYVYELPEYAHLPSDPIDNDAEGLGGVPNLPTASTHERNFRNPHYDLDFESVTFHEYAHSIQNMCFTPEEAAWIASLYAEDKRAGRFPGAYAMENDDEWFAVFSTVYLDGIVTGMEEFGIPRLGGREVLRRRYPWIHEFMEHIYNSR